MEDDVDVGGIGIEESALNIQKNGKREVGLNMMYHWLPCFGIKCSFMCHVCQ